MTETASSITYRSVVLCEIFFIDLAMDTLNNLDFFTSDLQNAYLQAPMTKNIWTTCGLSLEQTVASEPLLFERSTGSSLPYMHS